MTLRYGPFQSDEVLSPEECERLIESFADDTVSGVRNRALVALLWRCGLTHAEAIALEPGNFDWTMGFLTVRGTKETRGRELPLKFQASHLVANWDGMRRKLRKQRGESAPAPFFCTFETGNFGSGLSRPYIRGMLTRAASNAGIGKPVRTESLRDALALELRHRGFSLGAVARFLGDGRLTGKPRYHELPEGDFHGTGLQENWGQTQPTLRYFMRSGPLVPTGSDASELPSETPRQEVVAQANGSLAMVPSAPERSKVAPRETGGVEARLAQLEAKVEQQSRMIEKLLKEVKKR